MSGAAEGIASLALSAISVAALFTTCIECFDIVVAGKNFSEDYEQLCALVSGPCPLYKNCADLCSSPCSELDSGYGASLWAWCLTQVDTVYDMTRTSIDPTSGLVWKEY